jgi:hypothetical protein
MILKQLSCVAIISAFLPVLVAAQETKESRPFSFEKFHVQPYHGPLKTPMGVHKDADGAWRDELDKWVADPEVNFAGEYYLAAHSCGTECRYYTLNNLRSGRENKSISMFDASDPPHRTTDGHTYVPILFYKPDSRLLIVQFEISTPVERDACRQRYYIFENERFRPISKTLTACTREGDEPE